MKKIVLILHSLVFPLLFVAASFGQSTFERYAEQLPGFQLTLETRTDDASQAPHQLLSESLLELLIRRARPDTISRVYECSPSFHHEWASTMMLKSLPVALRTAATASRSASGPPARRIL